MTECEERAAVVAEALRWVGTPWRHAARAVGVGVDCGQLLIAAYAAIGVEAPDVGAYRQDWALHRSEERMRSVVESRCHRLPDGAAGAADIALFRYGRCLSHAAIIVEWPKVVHAYISVGRVVVDDALANADLAGRLGGVWSMWEGER